MLVCTIQNDQSKSITLGQGCTTNMLFNSISDISISKCIHCLSIVSSETLAASFVSSYDHVDN
jgi:hypothetical protein